MARPPILKSAATGAGTGAPRPARRPPPRGAPRDAQRDGESDRGENTNDDSVRRFRCPLCNREFSADAMACHAGCPISGHCRVLCCPHCGYEYPDEEATRRRMRRLQDLLRSVFGRRR